MAQRDFKEADAASGDRLHEAELRTGADQDGSISGITERQQERDIKRRGEESMYVMGIDSGSTSTNAVIMDQDRKIQGVFGRAYGAKSGQRRQGTA